MPEQPPHYYTTLAPFRALFGTGVPILTYHKILRRPPGVRMKGLYLDPELFERQMGELREARFESALPHEGLTGAPGRIVLTFDDGFRNVLQKATGSLAKHGFKGIQFLVANLLGKSNEWESSLGERSEPLMTREEVREWLALGHEIGSHTLTHPFLSRIPFAQAVEEIQASRKKLEDLFGRAIEHFCYPYGDFTPALADAVREAGYRTACTTEFGLNDSQSSPFQLKRITARYASRNWKNLGRVIRKRFLPK